MNEENITEDAPQMRSVALHSAMPTVPAFPRAGEIVKQAPFLASTPVVAGAETHREYNVSWKVPALTSLPSVYFLERTNTHVANVSPQEVGRRISECLRTESIAATFHENEVSRVGEECRVAYERSISDAMTKQALVEAQTKENVQFNVRLWNDKDQVAVEVQRLAGCCFLFHQCAKSVLRAAKGVPAASPTKTFQIPESIPRETEQETKECIEEGLEIAADLLKKDRIDAHLLAIESLVCLSKATKTRKFAAKCILCGEFLSTLLSLIESFQMDHQTYQDVTSQVQESHLFAMHRNALTILANCLVSLEEQGKLNTTLKTQRELCSNSLILALVEDVSKSDTRPHDACQAARCLQSLMRSSNDVGRKLLEIGATDKVQEAHQQGCCRHAQLERECQKLRKMM